MEKNINDDILLLGEANFSFTLSLLNYCDPKYVTTSCFENKETAIKKYGIECVTENLELLNSLNCKSILYGIDATKLDQHFPEQKFQRVVFMFPHVGGKSNLKKNRELIENFMKSARHVLKTAESFDILNNPLVNSGKSCVYITLARGQGGTSFEIDPKRRNIKDCWIICEIAQKCGYILTECEELCEDKFNFYKSTGFRSQGKSFHTKSGLVHKFELSLPLNSNKFSKNTIEADLPNLVWSFFIKSNFFVNNDSAYSQSHNSAHVIHPLVEFKYMLGNYFQSNKLETNVIKDSLEYSVSESPVEFESSYKVEKSLIKILNAEFKLDFDAKKGLYLRSSILDTLNNLKNSNSQALIENKLNILAGLTIGNAKPHENDTAIQLNNLKFEILLYAYGANGTNSDLVLNLIKAMLKDQYSNIETQIHKEKESTIKHLHLNKIKLAEIIEKENEFICILNSSSLLSILFKLDDERVLYSNDTRTFLENINSNYLIDLNNNTSFSFNWIIKKYSIENNIWYHDVSFWRDEAEFELASFLNTIREVCGDLVKCVELKDTYLDLIEKRCSRCYRLTYQSCDRALSHYATTHIQYDLRDRLVLRNKLKMR